MALLALTLQWTPPIGLFLVILVVGIALLFLLRRIANLPQRYFSVGCSSLFFSCALCLLILWLTHSPPANIHRVALFPMVPAGSTDQPPGLGYGLAHVGVDMLRKQATEQIQITPFDVLETATESHPPSDLRSALKACALVGAGYGVFGTYETDAAGVVTLQLYLATVADSSMISQEIRLRPDELASAPQRMIQTIRASFSFLNTDRDTPTPAPSPAFADYCRGQAMFHLGAEEGYWQASEAYRNGMKADSTFVYLSYGLAQIYNVWHRKGWTYKEENDLMRQKAVELAHAALILNPDLTETYRLLADAYLGLRQWDNQSLVLKQAITADPNDPWCYAALALLRRERFQDLGFKNEAEMGEQAARLNPESILLRVRLVYGYISAGALYDALDFATQTLELTPDHPAALMAAGEAYQFNGRARAAIEVYLRAVELEPDNPSAYIGLSNAYSLHGDPARAIETYERGMRRMPEEMSLYYNLAVLHQRHGKWDKATPLLEKAIAIGDYPNAHYYLARWYEKQGNREKAVHHWKQRVLLGDPHEKWTMEAMERLEKLSPSALPTIGVTR